ncbi:S1C family serine protease [Leptospira ryugenii]|nr:serine protease [Leptospira ryugenii]
MNKRIAIFFLFLFCFPILSQENSENEVTDIYQSVVLVRNDSYVAENKILPWTKKNLSTGLGSGVVLGKNLILTNAHVVMDSNRINVRLNGSQTDYPAKVVFVGYDCDLALLEIMDESFAENSKILKMSETNPLLGDDILVLGFPNGQDRLTVEKGSVLRYEKSRYSYSGLDFRNVIKINANVQPGNSGGPAIQNGKMIGLTFQISKTGKDLAYLIPNEIIRHFLKDIQDGRYDGFPNPGFTFQSGHPNSLKAVMKIPAEATGIFVNRIYPKSTFSKVLHEKDFIISMDGFPVSNEGELVQTGAKVSLIDYLESKYIGETVQLELYRAGKKYATEASLQKNFSLDLYRETSDQYFLGAGLVFLPISRSFFNGEEGDLDSSIKYHYSYFIQDLLYRYTNRDLVLSFLFDDPDLSKYKKYKYKILESINQRVPKDLNDLQKIWEEEKNGFIVLKFRGMELPIVLESEAIRQINIRVKKRYGVDDEK